MQCRGLWVAVRMPWDNLHGCIPSVPHACLCSAQSGIASMQRPTTTCMVHEQHHICIQRAVESGGSMPKRLGQHFMSMHDTAEARSHIDSHLCASSSGLCPQRPSKGPTDKQIYSIINRKCELFHSTNGTFAISSQSSAMCCHPPRPMQILLNSKAHMH